MKSFLRWTARIIAGLVAVVLLIYVVHGLWGMGHVHGAKGDARESVRMLQQDTGATDQIVKDNRSALGEPERSWSQVVCEIASNDSGWMVNDYTQICAWEVVDVHPASTLDRARDLRDPSDDVWVRECTRERCTEPVTTSAATGFGARAGTPPVWEVQGDLSGGRHTVVTVRGPRSTTVLGCNPWGIVFCSAPVDQPVMPQD